MQITRAKIGLPAVLMLMSSLAANATISTAWRTPSRSAIGEHGLEMNRETERRMVQRGVIGYWRGKTVVLLPLLSVHRGL
jgi:hypothetical protein